MQPGANSSPGRPRAPRPPDEVVERRIEEMRDDYIALVGDQQIIRKFTKAWGLSSKRQTKRYLAVVKARYKRERTEADADFLRQLEGVVVANIQRARATEQAAVTALRAVVVDKGIEMVPARDFRAETAAQAQELRGVERLCIMRGLDAPRRVEVSRTDKPENPFRLRARIKAEVEAGRSGGDPCELAATTPTEGTA